MFDNVCKYLAETFSEDYATWLLYRVIRLWEEPPDPFLTSPGLLPLAVLTRSDNATQRLREVAQALDEIEQRSVKADLTTATAVFGGLKVKPELIKTILRSDIMKESAVYQEILQEGEQRGLLKGKLEVAQRLLERGLSMGDVLSLTGLTAADLQTLSFCQDS